MNIKEAKKYHIIVDKLVQVAKKWIMYLDTLYVERYHRKNAYMLKYWDQIQAGSASPPQDSLLREAEQFFFKALFVNPYDFTALNGDIKFFPD